MITPLLCSIKRSAVTHGAVPARRTSSRSPAPAAPAVYKCVYASKIGRIIELLGLTGY